MSELVFLRLGLTDDAVQWCDCLGGNGIAVHQGSLADAAQALNGRRITVLVPGVDVLLTKANVPVRQRQRLVQAIPYALEEQLAGEVEDLHFAIGQRGKNGEIPVAVVTRAHMQEWLEILEQAGIQMHAMVPDTAVIPCAAGEWMLVLDDGNAWLRQGPQQCQAFDIAHAAELLELALASSSERPAVVRLSYDVAVDEELRAAIARCCEGMGVTLVQAPHEEVQHLFARGIKEANPLLDLLQGAYSRHEHFGRLWRPWRAAIVLIFAVVLVQSMHWVSHYRQLLQEERELTAQIEQLYLNTFPDARKVVNPRVQMEQRLQTLKQGAKGQEFIRLLSGAGTALRQQAGIEFRALYYQSGEMEFVVLAPDLKSLDKIKQDLLATGKLAVEITSANSTGERVEGRFQIRGGVL